jgi:serine/threonine protein kinase
LSAATVPPSIPDHELLRRIGAGSYGEVWLAKSVLGAFRAVKIVHRQSFDSDRPFEREFEGIQKFEPISRTHPSQVDVLQVGRRDDCFYYVMELADDLHSISGRDFNPETYEPKTLKSRTAVDPRLPFGECLRIGLALTEALEHLHTNSLVHRDVKPANIIFVNDVPKLADIGLVTDADATRTFVGTEGFLPPEGGGTPQADLYALGKVLYEISTGLDRREYPAAAADFGQSPERVQLLELEEIIEKACAPSPLDHYATAGQMRADLEALAAGQSVRRRNRFLRWRTRAWQAMGIAAAIAVVAGLALWLKPSRADSKLSSENPEAITAYQLGVFHGQKRTWAGYTNAIDELGRALALDPKFAEAHAALAEVCANQARHVESPPGPSWKKAERAANGALVLRPGLAQALGVLAIYEREDTRDLVRAEELCRRAGEAAPGQSGPHYVLSHVLAFQGRTDEAIAAALRASERDPTSALLLANVASRLIYARRFDDAIAEYQKAIHLQPTFYLPYDELGFLFLHLDREKEAMETLGKAWQLGAYSEAGARLRREALSQGGKKAYFELLLKLREQGRQAGASQDSGDIARYLVQLGRIDEAMISAETALQEHRNVFGLLEHPYYDAFRSHPRFPDFARRARIPVR